MKFKGIVSVAGLPRGSFEFNVESGNERIIAYMAQEKVEEIVERLKAAESIDMSTVSVEIEEVEDGGCKGCKGCSCGG